MTTPSGYTPLGAANATSLAAFAATTIEQWKAQLSGATISVTAMIQDAIRHIILFIEQIPFLGPLIAEALALAEQVLDYIGQVIRSILGVIETDVAVLISALTAFFTNVRAFFHALDFSAGGFDAAAALRAFVDGFPTLVQDIIPSLSTGWAGTIEGEFVHNELTNASLAANNLISGALATGVAITTAGGTIANDAVTAILGSADLGADLAALKTNINTALAGTAGTLADVATNLAAIPPPNIQSIWGLSDIGADAQAVVDAVTQASQGISAALNQNVSTVVASLQATFQSVIPHFW